MEQLTLEQAIDKFTNHIEDENTQLVAQTFFKEGADWQKEPYKRVFELLKGIAGWVGNLPDDRLTTATGPNDAALRGGLITDMRAIAVEAIRIIEPDYAPFEGYKHS